jgi:DNA-binding PucR family transcriptional regulator
MTTLDPLSRDDGWRALGWLRDLSPSSEVPPPASGASLISEAESRLGKLPVAWVIEVGHRMATLIVREMPEFGGGTEAFDILRMGTESSTMQFLLNLADHSQERIATHEALDGVLDFVRRGIGMESVLRGTRLGHRGMSESFLEACESLGRPDQRVEDMKFLTVRLFDFMDTFSAQLAGQYLEDQVRWSTSDSAARLELVRALLAGSEVDPVAAQRVLRYDIRSTHVALIAWSTESASDLDDVELQDACSRVLDRLEPTRRLVLPVGAGQVWAWGEVSATSAEHAPTDALPGLSRGVRVVVSSTDSGLAGFRATHAEADAIRRLLPAKSLPAVTAYGAVDVLTLLLEDRDRAASFAARELGALAERSAAHDDLRDTVAAFLDERGSTQAAAARLIVARNTVSYRLRRAEEIMGRTVRERSVQLRIALLIASAMPDAVAAARR